MSFKVRPMPVPEPCVKLRPGDFAEVLNHVPDSCVLIGGQAVAWWAERYGLKLGEGETVTSKDIDFWGTTHDLLQLAERMHTLPALPGRYEMTLLVGAIELTAGGRKTALEMLHTVPGLDSTNPEAVAVPERISTSTEKKLKILTPVSLVLSKLHALRTFSQEDRNDLLHLKVSLLASHAFISDVILQNVNYGLWNCNRLIAAQRQRPTQKMEKQFNFSILSAIPIEGIRSALKQGAIPAPDDEKLQKFIDIQWAKVSGGPPTTTGEI